MTIRNKKGTGLTIPTFAGLLIFAACSDQRNSDSVVQINQLGIEVVTSIDDLPKCDSDHEGEQALIKGEVSVRVCVDGKWYATLGSGDNSELSCTTKKLKDKSGLKIICNGDSIGVVLNGSDGKDGSQGVQGKAGANGKDGEKGDPGEAGAKGDDGTGCTLDKVDSKIKITCGDQSTILEIGADGNLTDDEPVVLDSEKIAISLDEVSGVTQKGPFLSGSKVLVREMTDGRTLTQTGNSFNGKILNDKGEFKINARMLVSQYVMLEATGYYRNEVTGENSGSELTLFAITNVNDRNIVNVNLLTHLEYERVVYLVTQKKMKVAEAKKQAQKEVFALLDIDATGFSNSEDLNIAGSSDEDGALLAFSILFQGDRQVAALSELLSKISTDMKEDGTWDDSKTKHAAAEWAADADSSGRLEKIRMNVANWGLSNMVPNFEKHVRHFWTKEYGLGDCAADSTDIVKAATAGKRKGTQTRYICRDGRWVIANDFEKDTYGWKAGNDGEIKAGDVTAVKYVYDETGSYNGSKGWRLASDLEKLYGGCHEEIYNEYRRDVKNGDYFQCQEKSHSWVLISNNMMIDTQNWTEEDDGYSKWGDSIGVVTSGSKICYVFDTSATYKGWRKSNNSDCTLGLLGCTEGRAGRMLLADDGNYYNCVNNMWSQVTNVVQRNTYGKDCKDSNAGEMILGKIDDIYFVCNSNAWRQASQEEEKAYRVNKDCRMCTEGMQGLTEDRDGTMFICDKKTWRDFNCAEKKKGVCTTNDSSLVEACATVGGFEIDYICSDDHWHAIQYPFEYTLEQWKKKREAYYTAAVHPDAEYADDFEDPRDHNVYKTVVINGQRVFAENLRYSDSVTAVNLKGNSWCYNNEPKNCEIGGRYYTWTAAVNLDHQWQYGVAVELINTPHQGMCPPGWHIPSTEEWKALFSNLVSDHAIEMMGFSNGEWWTNATDASGFSSLPMGRYDSEEGNFSFVPNDGYWSTTESPRWPIRKALSRGTMDYYKTDGLSVRCIED